MVPFFAHRVDKYDGPVPTYCTVVLADLFIVKIGKPVTPALGNVHADFCFFCAF